MYIGYGMLVQYQIVIFAGLTLLSIAFYTVCHVDLYVKVHQVQIKFGSSWQIVLVIILSGICHSFLVMAYSLTV